MERLLNLDITETDTFGGEVNWLVVHRLSIKHSGKDTTRAIVRRVKRELGISNIRSITEDMGDGILIWYQNMIAFVSFPDEEGHPLH